MTRIVETRRAEAGGVGVFFRQSRDGCSIIELYPNDREEIVESGLALVAAPAGAGCAAAKFRALNHEPSLRIVLLATAGVCSPLGLPTMGVKATLKILPIRLAVLILISTAWICDAAADSPSPVAVKQKLAELQSKLATTTDPNARFGLILDVMRFLSALGRETETEPMIDEALKLSPTALDEDRLAEAFDGFDLGQGWPALGSIAPSRDFARMYLKLDDFKAMAVSYDSRFFAAGPADSQTLADEAALDACILSVHEPCGIYARGDGVEITLKNGRASLLPQRAIPFVDAEGHTAYANYLDKPAPKAFAISASGRWGMDWGAVSDDEAKATALEKCNQKSSDLCGLFHADEARRPRYHIVLELQQEIQRVAQRAPTVRPHVLDPTNLSRERSPEALFAAGRLREAVVTAIEDVDALSVFVHEASPALLRTRVVEARLYEASGADSLAEMSYLIAAEGLPRPVSGRAAAEISRALVGIYQRQGDPELADAWFRNFNIFRAHGELSVSPLVKGDPEYRAHMDAFGQALRQSANLAIGSGPAAHKPALVDRETVKRLEQKLRTLAYAAAQLNDRLFPDSASQRVLVALATSEDVPASESIPLLRDLEADLRKADLEARASPRQMANAAISSIDDLLLRERQQALTEAYLAAGQNGAAVRTILPLWRALRRLNERVKAARPSTRREKLDQLLLIGDAAELSKRIRQVIEDARVPGKHHNPVECGSLKTGATDAPPRSGSPRAPSPRDWVATMRHGGWARAIREAMRGVASERAVLPLTCLARDLRLGVRPRREEMPELLFQIARLGRGLAEHSVADNALDEASRLAGDTPEPEFDARIALERSRLHPMDPQVAAAAERALSRLGPQPTPLRAGLLQELGVQRLLRGEDARDPLQEALLIRRAEIADQSPEAVQTERSLSLAEQEAGSFESALEHAKAVFTATDDRFFGKPLLRQLEIRRLRYLSNTAHRPAPVVTGDTVQDPLGFDGIIGSADDIVPELSTTGELGPVALQNATQEFREAGRADLADAASRYVIAKAIERSEQPLSLAFYRQVFGVALFQEGNLMDAEGEISAALEAEEDRKDNGQDPGAIQLECSYLINIRRTLGRLAEAEQTAERCQTDIDRSRAADSPWTAKFLNEVAAVLVVQGRDEEARPLLERARELLGGVLLNADNAQTYAEVGIALERLTNRRTHRSASGAAEALYDILSWLGFVTSEYPTSVIELAGEYLADIGQASEAEAFLAVARRRLLSELGPDHPAVVATLGEWGRLARISGQPHRAELVTTRAVVAELRNFGQAHPIVAGDLAELGRLALDRDDPKTALAFLDQATQLREEEWTLSRKDRSIAEASPRVIHLSSSAKQDFIDYAEALRRLQPGSEDAFRAVQRAERSDTATALLRTAARISPESPEVASILQILDDWEVQWRQADTELRRELVKPASVRLGGTEQALRERLQRAASEIRQTETSVPAVLSRLGRITDVEPLGMADVQHHLAKDEALIAYQVGEAFTHLWVVRQQAAEQYRLEITAAQLDDEIGALRRSIVAIDPAGAARSGLFAPQRASTLYQRLLGPAEAILRGATHLIIVPDGALAGIPFQVLIASPPAQNQPIDWLADHFAITVLPAIAVLPPIDAYDAIKAPQRLLGIGDPLVPTHINSAGFLGLAFPPFPAYQRLAAIYETSDELKQIGTRFGPENREILVEGDATKARLVGIDLRNFDLIVFATHALTAAQSRDAFAVPEPGIVLTPPALGGNWRDALLTTGDIAGLHFYDPLVVLSACNTAESDGTVRGEALSGLARAFFAAGSRNIVISHWSVPSVSAARLIPDFVRFLEEAPENGRAAALRAAVTKLRDDPSGAFRHPLFWAGFSFVGDGSGVRQ